MAVLLLSVDSQRYMFNAPEGTTRSLIEQGAKGISRGLSQVFIPRVGVEECGGLPGEQVVRGFGTPRKLTFLSPGQDWS